MNKDILVSVATVLEDSKEVLEPYIQDVSEVLSNEYHHYEILIIINNEGDLSANEVTDLLNKFKNVRVITLSKQYHEEVVFTAALENAIGDYVIIMDINQDPAQLIPKMIKMCIAGSDIVTAESSELRKETYLYHLGSYFFYKLSNLLTSYKLDLNWSDFICFSRKTVNSILQIKNKVRYIKYIIMEIGFTHSSIKYLPKARVAHKKKINYMNRSLFALETILSSTDKLLMFSSFVSFIAFFICCAYCIHVIFLKFVRENMIEGWAAENTVMTAMFGLLFLLLGVIIQYLLLIYKESKREPLYYVSDDRHSTSLFGDSGRKNVL